MAALDELDISNLPLQSQSVYKNKVAQIVWQLFDMKKDESIKIKIKFIPISIKVSKLEFLIARLVGSRPD